MGKFLLGAAVGFVVFVAIGYVAGRRVLGGMP